MTKDARYSLLNNSRFYILASSVLLSIFVASWIRLHVASEQLFYIRTEQVFGLLCFAYWYVAIIISPLGYVIGKQRLRGWAFARRAIGVSAAYFAVLHMVTAVWGQLGGPQQLTLLPPLFQWSLFAGGIAVVILLLMAATSFDAAIGFMTFRRWKWLHRLVYAGGILAVVHVWLVGSHVVQSGVQAAAFVALVVITGLETYRVVQLLGKRFTLLAAKEYAVVTFITVWMLWVALIIALPTLLPSYHGKHTDTKPRGSSHGREQ